jgi:hypothetical protein
MQDSYLFEWFYGEPDGTFSNGHVFTRTLDLTGAQADPAFGYWHCNVLDRDRLTWSDIVYGLFGLPPASPIDRDWAVSRYSEASKRVLQTVRTYALGRKLGFILDAEINPVAARAHWIRMLAVPTLAQNRVVGLHGLKRAL